MPRGKKTEVNPVNEMPVVEVQRHPELESSPVKPSEVQQKQAKPDQMRVFDIQPVYGESNISQPVTERKPDNVIPFTGTDQPVQPKSDTTQIDQFLAQYGIEII